VWWLEQLQLLDSFSLMCVLVWSREGRGGGQLGSFFVVAKSAYFLFSK